MNDIPQQFTPEEKQVAAQRLLQEALQKSTAFMLSYIEQPEHVAVIIAVSRMDELLGLAIRKRLRPCPDRNDDLLDTERGVGTLSNRIALAYRLGLIDSTLARALHLFRKIRNDFAHAYEGQILSSSPHRDRVDELAMKIKTHPNITVLQELIGKSGKMSSHKLSFIIASTLAITRLETLNLAITTVDNHAAGLSKFP